MSSSLVKRMSLACFLVSYIADEIIVEISAIVNHLTTPFKSITLLTNTHNIFCINDLIKDAAII
jgi:hypothetical protein